jgi:hypothetical protein
MRTFVMIIITFIFASAAGQSSIDKYFTYKVLRFDFMLAGNSTKT